MNRYFATESIRWFVPVKTSMVEALRSLAAIGLVVFTVGCDSTSGTTQLKELPPDASRPKDVADDPNYVGAPHEIP